MPPFYIEPYRNPEATTLLNLVGGADRAHAAATMAAGQAIAQGAQNVGQDLGTTLNTLAKYKMDEPRRKLEAIQVQQATQQQADDTAARSAFVDAQGDPEQAIAVLERKGNYPVAMKLRADLTANKVKALDITSKQLDVTDKTLAQATQLLQGVTAAKDPASAYASILPQVRTLVGPSLATKLPDQYDPDTVTQALTWGMKAGDVLRMRRDAATTARNGLQNAVTRTDLTGKLTDALAKSASTVESQDEWDHARTLVQKLGGDVAPDVLAQFPETFDAPTLKAAATKILTAGQTTTYEPKPVLATVNGKATILEAGYDKTRNAWFATGDTTHPLTNVRPVPALDQQNPADRAELVKALQENPQIYNDLTDSAKTDLWPDLHRAGFTPPAPRDRSASAATAERWRMTQLQKVTDQLNLREIDEDQAAAQRAAIEASYKVQTGGDQAKPTGTPAPAGAPPAAPPASSPAAAPPVAARPVPPAVQQLLGTQKPGKYTLTDGSIWIKDKTGHVTPGS